VKFNENDLIIVENNNCCYKSLLTIIKVRTLLYIIMCWRYIMEITL